MHFYTKKIKKRFQTFIIAMLSHHLSDVGGR